jgi:dihydrofolate synthase/folylpolyglutamate synthase
LGWKIPDKAVYRGLSEVTTLTGLQGRWQIIGHNPLIVCDTGHNEEGIREVVSQIRQTPHRKLHFVLGVVADKDVSKILPLLPDEAIYYFTKANIPRAMEAGLLRDKAVESRLQGESYPEVRQAFEAAKAAAQKEDLVFVGGSNFVVAEIL